MEGCRTRQVFSFPLVPRNRRLEPERRVQDVVPRQRKHLQRSVYATPGETGRSELQHDVRGNPARGPHGAQSAGQLDRLQNRTSDADLVSDEYLFIYFIRFTCGWRCRGQRKGLQRRFMGFPSLD